MNEQQQVIGAMFQVQEFCDRGAILAISKNEKLGGVHCVTVGWSREKSTLYVGKTLLEAIDLAYEQEIAKKG